MLGPRLGRPLRLHPRDGRVAARVHRGPRGDKGHLWQRLVRPAGLRGSWALSWLPGAPWRCGRWAVPGSELTREAPSCERSICHAPNALGREPLALQRVRRDRILSRAPGRLRHVRRRERRPGVVGRAGRLDGLTRPRPSGQGLQRPSTARSEAARAGRPGPLPSDSPPRAGFTTAPGRAPGVSGATGGKQVNGGEARCCGLQPSRKEGGADGPVRGARLLRTRARERFYGPVAWRRCLRREALHDVYQALHLERLG